VAIADGLVPDQTLGYLILGVGILFVLGLVFAITTRVPGRGERPVPPPGVHLPNPSRLPVVFAIGAALIGAGLAFHPKGQVINFLLAIPGLAVFVYAAVSWVRDAGHEWHETEGGSHHDSGGH
jgi:hypothetical protein